MFAVLKHWHYSLWAESTICVATSISDVKTGDSHLAAQKAFNKMFPASRRNIWSDSSPTFSFTPLSHIFLSSKQSMAGKSVHALCEVCLVTEIEIHCSHDKFSDGNWLKFNRRATSFTSSTSSTFLLIITYASSSFSSSCVLLLFNKSSPCWIESRSQ